MFSRGSCYSNFLHQLAKSFHTLNIQDFVDFFLDGFRSIKVPEKKVKY